MSPRLQRGLRLVERFFAIVGVLLTGYHLGLDVSPVASGSMAPTLQDEDWLLSEKLSYRLRQPRRWELVLFHDRELGFPIAKRVVALPGESVALQAGAVVIDAAPVTRPASLAGLRYLSYGQLAPGHTVRCGEGYFLLGDDSKDSQDSRFEGPLPPPRIVARPWLVVWPPARIGRVNP